MYKQWPLFGTEICSDNCPRATLKENCCLLGTDKVILANKQTS